MSRRTGMTAWLRVGGILASAALLALYARGGIAWPLGFVLLLPWLIVLDGERHWRGALFSGWLMSVAFAAFVLPWFGLAIGAYTGIGAPLALTVLLLVAPLLQPQLLAFALVRHALRQRHGPWLAAFGGAAAWVACEWAFPKLFGDTLGHGLQPSALLRQAADLGGAAGLSFVLVLVNQALAQVAMQWRQGARRAAWPLGFAVALVVAMAGYGQLRLHALADAVAQPAPTIRIGMVQANMTDYEARREAVGAYAVVREVLDAHYALSRAALEHHAVDALLWSETVYPTTFGQPRSEDGAAFDREILAFVDALGVPLVFGTYVVDADGEYNAAAFVEPGVGLVGMYRKTHPFPLTEHVPGWLDGPRLRRLLPWAGGWLPGSGARVFPLRTRDGREVNVLPLICLDDVRTELAIDGARLGAQAILGLSNDSWFSASPQGARLHLTVAAFRSIETRLPQIRVTTNGMSALVDETGEVLVHTGIGDQAVLAGVVAARDPLPTLVVRWGDWVGRAAACVLLLLLAASALRALAARPAHAASAADGQGTAFEHEVVALTPAWRATAALLRLTAGAGLLWLGLAMLFRDGLQVNSLAQISLFAAAVVAPAMAAWAIAQAFAGRLRVDVDGLVLELRGERIEIPTRSVSALRVWRLPVAGSGVDLILGSGERYLRGIALPNPAGLRRALSAAGIVLPAWEGLSKSMAALAELRATPQRWYDRALLKFVLFPLLPALPAFRLHQHIAFGGTFGEAYTYGWQAWLTGLALWWAAWAIGMVLFAALLRTGIEVATLLAWRFRPTDTAALRPAFEWLARMLFYVGVPAWMLWRMLGQ